MRRLRAARPGSDLGVRADAAGEPVWPLEAGVDWLIGDFCRAHGLGAVSLRYFNVAGASHGLGEDHDPETHLIPNILRAALGTNPFVEIFGTDYPTRDGTAIRDYIHVDDLAEAHVLALDGTRAGEHRIFNLGNGNGFSVREVVAAAEEITGVEVHAREILRMREITSNILVRHTGQPFERIEKDVERDYIMIAEQAKEYGIIDQIIAKHV